MISRNRTKIKGVQIIEMLIPTKEILKTNLNRRLS